jgi:AsmA protein
MGAKPFTEGRVTLKAPSAAWLSRMLGLELTGVEAIGAVSADGELRTTADSVILTSATLAAGKSSGTGTLGLETDGERPRLIANVRLATLDLDQILPIRWNGSVAPSPGASVDAGSPGRFAAPDAAAGPSAGLPRSIGDLLEREAASPPGTDPATRVKGFRKRLGNEWDVDAIDVAPFRAVDIEGRFQIASLRGANINGENLQAGVELKGGVLRLSLTDGRIAGGVVRGLASLDTTRSPMTIGANLSGDNVAVRPLLELAGINLLDGHGRMILALSAQGASERELVSTLAGRAEIKVTDGALVGWDADAIVSDLGRGQIPPTERRPDARTPFNELSGNFQVAQGVARSRDLKLDSRTVSASGTATINIVDRNVDILLKPRIAKGGLEVPVRIAGAWDAPSLVADVASLIKSPKAQEAVKHLKDGNVDGALRSVLGGGPKAEEKIDKAKEVLRGLLGR